MSLSVYHIRVLPDIQLKHQYYHRQLVMIGDSADIQVFVDNSLLHDRVGYAVQVCVNERVTRPLRYADLEVQEIGIATSDQAQVVMVGK